jgi:hypothetical protein
MARLYPSSGSFDAVWVDAHPVSAIKAVNKLTLNSALSEVIYISLHIIFINLREMMARQNINLQVELSEICNKA